MEVQILRCERPGRPIINMAEYREELSVRVENRFETAAGERCLDTSQSVYEGVDALRRIEEGAWPVAIESCPAFQ